MIFFFEKLFDQAQFGQSQSEQKWKVRDKNYRSSKVIKEAQNL